jgi:hypothetical protein
MTKSKTGQTEVIEPCEVYCYIIIIMKSSFFFSFVLAMAVLFPLLTGALSPVEPRLYVNSPENASDYVQVNYEVNMPGFVELHLFSPEGDKLWIKGKVTDRIGMDYIKVPKSPLKAGARYTFILKFKGKDYKGTFWAD